MELPVDPSYTDQSNDNIKHPDNGTEQAIKQCNNRRNIGDAGTEY